MHIQQKSRSLSFVRTASCVAAGAMWATGAFAANRVIELSDSERVAIYDEAGMHTFKVPANITGTAQLLVVGGGGGGGGVSGGGGGGGQVVQASGIELTPEAVLDVVVAAGGTSGYNASGSNGGTSSFLTYTAIGGGGGGGGWSPVDGKDGANGGGAGGNGNVAKTGGAATVEGGFPGADSLANYWGQGGGGGAAEAGRTRETGVENPGCGGAGIVSDITGEEVMYGYGGGSTQGKLSGAMNEWGKGDNGANDPGSQGQDGTGGGGGAGRWGGGSDGYAGGTGTVIIRYSLDLTQVAADFSVEKAVGFAPFVASFTATVDAPAGSTPTLTWNFGDGTEPVVSEVLTATHTYQDLGSYTVSLKVEAAGKTFVKTYENLISVVQEKFYVDAASANPTAPYATPETAAQTLTAALAQLSAPGQTIYVAPGTYATASGTDSFDVDPSAYEITSAVNIVGMGETPDDVVFTRSGNTAHRLFYLNHADAKVKNVTIKGGWNSGTKTALGGNVYIGAAGGTFEDCVIKDGNTSNWAAGGGNVGMLAGRLSRCVLSGGKTSPDGLNAGRKGGSCVYMTGGIIENSLIYGNTNGYVAVVMADTSTLASCTIAGNTGTLGAGVYVAKNTCKVTNCAIGDNTVSNDSTGHGHVWLGANENLGSCFTSCAANVDLGEGSVKANSVGFVGQGDYHLGAASICRDAAKDYATSGALSATDLDGNDRQSGTAIDIGCYEFDAEALNADFSADKSKVFTGGEVVFTAVVSGGTGTPVLQWDFDGDGVIDLETTELVASHAYTTTGVYRVTLTVGPVFVDKPGCVTAGPKDAYVDDDSAEEGVYATIQAAYADAIDGTTIHVAPGEYLVVGEKTLEITKGVKLIGEGSSPDAVVLRQTYGWKRYYGFKTLLVANEKAVVANMTIADGSADNGGAAGCLQINAAGGTVSNCVIRGGIIDNTQAVWAGGVMIQNGLLTHSVISNCTVRSLNSSNGPRAQAVYAEGNARVENCLVRDMKGGVGAAIVVLGAASVKNCTVVDCEVGPWIQNRGTWYETNACYGVHCSAGTVVNTAALNIRRAAFVACRAYGDSTPVPATDYAAFGPTPACFTTCACDGEKISPSSFVIDATAFADYAGGNYVPAVGSALYDAGTDIPGWTSDYRDLAGKSRIMGRRIDIGCYEASSGFFFYVR